MFFAALFGCFAGTAVAQMQAGDTGLESLQTGDAVRGWEAVGRIDFGTDSFCTGTLIDPNTVVTAAHCLFDDDLNPFSARVIEFRAGLRNGRPEATRRVTQVAIHPSYDPTQKNYSQQVRHDVAMLRLSQPIRNPGIVPLAFSGTRSNDPTVGVVSYAQDRAEAPSLQERCTVLAAENGMLVTSCSVNFGASGAPIFRFENGTPYLVSVVSAMAELEGQKVSLGADLAQPITEVSALLNGQRLIDTGNTGARMLRPGERSDTGALFIRP